MRSSVHSRKRSPRLIIVCGLPGSGKTTLAQEFERRLGGVRLCPDEWMTALAISVRDAAARGRIEALQWSLAQRLLKTGNIVIIEWGTWSRSERHALWAGARALGAAVELHTMTAAVEELWERIESRASEYPPITRDQVEQWSEQFETPTEEELALYDRPLTKDLS